MRVPQSAVLALTPLFASFSLFVVGHGLLGTLLAVRMTLEGFSEQLIGFVAACYSIGFIVGTRLDGRAIRKVQHIRTFAAMSAIAASTTLALALLVDPMFWAAMRLLYGCSLAGLYMVTESWLNANTPVHDRGKVLGLYSVITYVGLGGGQFLLLVADPQAMSLFLLVTILISLALVPLALMHSSSPELMDIHAVPLRELYRLQPAGLAGALGSGVILGSFINLGPVFAKQSGFSSLEISLFMGLTLSGGFLMQWPIGLLSDRYSRHGVIPVISLCVAALSFAIIYVTGSSVAAVIALAVLWGAFSFTLYPVSVALVNDYVDSAQFVEASAGLLLMSSLGMISGSLAAGQVMAVMGADGLFWIAFATSLGLTLFTGLVRRPQPSPELVDHSRYHVLPRNSPYALALDPRGDVGVQLEFDFESPPPDSPTEAQTQASRPMAATLRE